MVGGQERPSNMSGALSGEASDHVDAALLRHLEDLCPIVITLAPDIETEWVLDPVCQEGDGSTDYAIVPSLGDWVEVNPAGCTVVQKRPHDDCADARNASIGIQKELQWYFQERDSRFFGYRSNPVERPCARTVFARRLLRYAGSSLPFADEILLEAWCQYLRAIIKERPFSSSNILWVSKFEKSLEACLARLERLLKKVQGSGFPELSMCPVERQVVNNAMNRREMTGTFTTVPVERFAIWRQLSRVDGVLSKVQTRLPILPGLQTLAIWNGWAASIFFGTACFELAYRLAMELRSYAAGEVDGRTLTEDIFIASGSAAAFALGRYATAIVSVGEGFFANFMVEQLGPSSAAFLVSLLLRAAGQEIQGGPRMRALRNAYASLGLSPSGTLTYTPKEIETQLEYRLRRPGRDERMTVRLWAAYAYIREHQHPELADPWQHVRDACDGTSNINYPSACEAMQLDPEQPFTSAELRRCYLRLSLMHHPDRPTGDHETYLRLHAAYELLRCFCQD